MIWPDSLFGHLVTLFFFCSVGASVLTLQPDIDTLNITSRAKKKAWPIKELIIQLLIHPSNYSTSLDEFCDLFHRYLMVMVV